MSGQTGGSEIFWGIFILILIVSISKCSGNDSSSGYRDPSDRPSDQELYSPW